MSTSIRTCTCKHEYQDKKYGKQKRVFNQTQRGDYRCTVCLAVQQISNIRRR